MRTPEENSRLLMQTIGMPIGSGDFVPDEGMLEELTSFAFKSRVGLLFLDECVKKGASLGPKASELHRSLSNRRIETDKVVVKLAMCLDQVAKGEWTLFKSIKPFASTPNDTDWFPFERSRHSELVEHLCSQGGGFKLMEKAPLQTTLIEEGGIGVTDTTKKGGVYYIDCYVAPSTDYFIYLDPRRMKNMTEIAIINGYPVTVLQPHAELAAIMFHNVFPEKTFTIESYYLVKRYLDLMEERDLIGDFGDVCREQKVEYAAAANLVMVRQIDLAQFGIVDSRIKQILADLKLEDITVPGFSGDGAFPYAISTKVFWKAFLSKQRDRTSFLSTLNQFVHMLNPVFFVDVAQIVWKRTIRGGVYEQN